MFFSKRVEQFITIAQKGTFKEAADELCISPSALSKGMKEIEGQLGVQLFRHSGRGARLTSNGEKLYQELFPHYQDVSATTKKLMLGFSSKKESVINIATDDAYFPDLASIISKIDSIESGILVDIKKYSNRLISDIICRIQADIFIGSREEENLPANIESLALSSKLELGAAEDIINNYKDKMELLLNNNIIQTESMLLSKGFERIKNLLMDKHKKNIISVPSIDDVFQILSDGKGISFIPKSNKNISLGKQHKVNFAIPPAPFNIEVRGKLYYKAEKKESLQWLIDLICD
ncbi:LysR family transcriptional regulator [Arsenophonus sp. aPb]|uniref:helix-turn-helix domain-containing protein n=1 Tax=Arsenophonus sp. aPb TaxID=3041619 RepID=UPI00246900CF|nr:LysR family transcriptional regulator [Arsenophonus sp. aPb]WGL98006.1 LysR family transcriptional regulator [Arsenophonus sp. aPb]